MKTSKKIHNSYIIDSHYRIIDVHSQWDKFAADNEGNPNIYKKNILFKNIMDFIKGDAVKMWYESIISLSKTLNIHITRPYRCDSPDKKRFMEMEVIPLQDGNILINHYLIKEEAIKTSVSSFIFHRADEKNSLLRCSVCNQFLHINRWIELEEAVKHYDFRSLNIIDIICNYCIRQKIEEI